MPPVVSDFSKLKIWFGAAILVILAAVAFLAYELIEAWPLHTYRVVDYGMMPTAYVGEVLVGGRDPDEELHRGDLVLVQSKRGTVSMRRLVGMPGDTVELRHFQAFVNGQPEQPPYGGCGQPVTPMSAADEEKFQANWGPRITPIGQYALFGDCRKYAADVRYVGFSSRAQILKRRFWILFSADAAGGIRFDRIGQRVK